MLMRGRSFAFGMDILLGLRSRSYRHLCISTGQSVKLLVSVDVVDKLWSLSTRNVQIQIRMYLVSQVEAAAATEAEAAVVYRQAPQ